MAFSISSAQVGRSIVAPPGVPAERVAVLRAALDAMLKDPDLLAEIDSAARDRRADAGDRAEVTPQGGLSEAKPAD
jgi:tripartite-type tricarboxylate transporter receptor subunit TctC